MYQDDTGKEKQKQLTLTELYALCDEWARWYAYHVNIALEEAQRAMQTLLTDEFRQAWAELAEAVTAFATAYDVGEVPKPTPPKPPYLNRTGYLHKSIPAKGVRPTYYTVATPTDKPYRIQHRRSRHK